MTLDLLHNKIIKETVTESFEKSVNDNLVPKLIALYGASLEGVQFYEDYINDNFIKDGYWYYPLTVVIGGIHAVVWIKWDIAVAADFKGGNPYAYIGNGGIDFIFADDVPIAFKNSLLGRGNYFEGGCVKLNVTTDAPDPTILAGKYSQTFVDEMNRQLSAALGRACGIKGLPTSSIELDLVFAPNTYMEHTSENVTYRRLLISAKGCAARDFWIKWTRKNSALAYSVNDNVVSDDIVFELGEDVSQKIREKEYRFLVYGNSDKYRVAMGRKNVTEWRELIKRAVKRGELIKTMDELEENSHVAEVSDKLSEILEKCGVSVPVSTSNDIRVDAEVANEALRLAVLGNGDSETENYVPEFSEENDAVSEAIVEVDTEAVAEETIDEVEVQENSLEEDDAVENDAETVSDVADSVFDNLPDDEFGEFELTRLSGKFDLTEQSVEELSFEDILEEFIPKSDAPEDESEYTEESEKIDISDIDESESIHFDIEKSDDPELGENTNASESEEFEIEIYEDVEAEDEDALLLTDEEESDVIIAGDDEEILEADGVNSYDEADEIKSYVSQSSEVTYFENQTSIDSEAVVLLEKEIEILKLENEALKTEKDDIAFKLNEAMAENMNLENKLEAERECRSDIEAKLRSAEVAKGSAEDQINLELLAAADLRAQIEKQKFAIDQIKKLAEDEGAARKNAENELELLRIEIESLKADNEHLKNVARVSEEACRAAEQLCKQHERELLNQIELTEKERVREKNLFAEAARQAKEENEQRFAEMKEAEIARIEEEARIEALRRAEEDRLRLEDALRFERDRIESESSVQSSVSAEDVRKKELEDRAREARLRMEERARLNAEARANVSVEYKTPATTSYAQPSIVEENYADVINDVAAPETIENAPVELVTPAPVVNYNYTSYIVRLMFRRSADPNVTARIHEMISYALTDFGKEHIYMKVKASMPDNYTVVLNFVKFPEEEFDLLVKIINYLGKSDLGVYKVVLD